MKKIIFLMLFASFGWQQAQAQCPDTAIAFKWGPGTTYTYQYDGVRSGKCAYKQADPESTIEWTGSQWNIYGTGDYSGSPFWHSTVDVGDRPSNKLSDWSEDFGIPILFISGTGTIGQTPLVAPTASAQTFCNSGTVANLVAKGETSATFSWYELATGGTALTTSTTLTTGTYYVSQTVGVTESARTSVSITVNNVSVPTGDAVQTFTVAELATATIANLVVTPSSVIWYANTADAQSGTNALLTTRTLESGATYYAVNSINDCKSDPFAVTVNTGLGTVAFSKSLIQLFPNPTTSILTLKMQNNTQVDKLVVTDLTGKKVAEISNSNQINVAKLAKGIYILEAFSGQEKFTNKFIKE